MAKQVTPTLMRLDNRKYQCTDIPALHAWLEGRGYHFYGQHDPGEYGRFSLQEMHEVDDRRSYVHSFIQVFDTGQVYSPDPFACELLDTLAIEGEDERSV
jgi:hypothetical protein